MIRKAVAFAIVVLAAGTLVEAQTPYPQWHRVPVDGAIVIGTVALIEWALRELSEGEEA